MASNPSSVEIEVGQGNLYTAWDTYQPAVFGPPMSNSNQVVATVPLDLRSVSTSSLQIFGDGGATLDWVYEITQIPSGPMPAGQTVLGAAQRDDSVGSAHWAVADSGTLPVGAPASDHRTQPYACARNGRLVISWDANNAASAVAHVLVLIRGTRA